MLHPEYFQNDQYYYRVINPKLNALLLPQGKLNWLVDYVRKSADLDFLIGSNKTISWISVYRGLSRLVTIRTSHSYQGQIKIEAAKAYKEMVPELYERDEGDLSFENALERLRVLVSENERFNRYYSNQKEGYYQNLFSRKFGIEATEIDPIIVLDKEVVLGHKSTPIKGQFENDVTIPFRDCLQTLQVANPERFGSKVGSKALGTELDFLALDGQGNVIVIEFKHYDGKAYLAPTQLGVYYHLLRKFQEQYPCEFEKAIKEMFEQKMELGLIPREGVEWNLKLIPWIVVSEFYEKSSQSKQKMYDILYDRTLNRGCFDQMMMDLRVFSFNGQNISDVELQEIQLD